MEEHCTCGAARGCIWNAGAWRCKDCGHPANTDITLCDAAELKAALDSIHAALGEARESDDASLGAIVAEIVADLKQRTIALDEANAALAERTGQVATLTEAIGFYADPLSWRRRPKEENCDAGYYPSEAHIDKGKYARRALSSPPVAAMRRVIEAVKGWLLMRDADWLTPPEQRGSEGSEMDYWPCQVCQGTGIDGVTLEGCPHCDGSGVVDDSTSAADIAAIVKEVSDGKG